MGEPAMLLSDAAVYNYHKCLKAMFGRAYKLGVIDENPYDRMKGELKRGDRETMDYLTDEEMEAFESIHPLRGSMMDVAHDLFVFQMYTGLSYGDMQAFDIKNYRLVDGAWRNVGERIKTGVPYVSQLLPPAVAVLEKYNFELPKIGNADYNHALKALGMACGISRPLHSHMARHTFATFALRQGVKIENLARMLGHTNITQTQRYAKVVAQSVHEEFDLLKAAIEKK
jgi:integrase